MQRKQRRVSPHVLRLNDHVYQRYNPWNSGQVTRLVKGHSFTVVYDYPGRRSGEPRQRYTYPITSQDLFLVGTAPDVMIPPAPDAAVDGDD
jgi:hypothetical protein